MALVILIHNIAKYVLYKQIDKYTEYASFQIVPARM